MLVLSRKAMESIQIGNGVVVTVLQIRGSTVRIGIDAPPEIHVRRTELPERVSKSPHPGDSSGAQSRILVYDRSS